MGTLHTSLSRMTESRRRATVEKMRRFQRHSWSTEQLFHSGLNVMASPH